MTSIIKKIAVLTTAAVTFISCNKDDNASQKTKGEGTITLKFDNIYQSADLAFNTPYTNSNGEVIKIGKLRYIISNITLTQENGTVYTVPKSESYFIVNEEDTASTKIRISNVPSGNYTKVSFGVGVDEQQFLLGAEGQGDFLTQAQDLEMMWSWSAGYKFINFEGSYTSASTTSETMFKVHTGKTGDNYNYTEISADFPSKALVRTTISPSVHLMVDISKITDGHTKINFDEGSMVMGGAKVQDIMTYNVPQMFRVDHIHND